MAGVQRSNAALHNFLWRLHPAGIEQLETKTRRSPMSEFLMRVATVAAALPLLGAVSSFLGGIAFMIVSTLASAI